ncbi:hypothetical protein D6C98_07107 [Aureobasidium pullulans]|uniref:Transcription factor domain-containing protein n=1 Tax=Aureobasidium pullulans TaxID=5580 RepID=A0A4S8WB47_AURPU|nr:hypothetical protein D6D24_01584 [Aureobasidium pullulans]THY06571.1 hypothetical protein D6D03_02294 [Aureobasidium pullulans]THY47434.1 hypothetical protein D6C98_07107 [Aureobasidium pullulans]
MCHAVETAIKLVTKNEDLVNSVEGIECIMLEAAYQNYAGNLHQAWMAVRRATTTSQVLGLHRCVSSPSLKFLEPQTRTYFNAEMTCFRLVQMDAYLGLVLGLPRSSLQAHDRILRRKGEDLSETQELDLLLEKAASDMPSQWWLMPDLSPGSCTESELARDTNRLMTQFSQYHLLIRLHLPYLMRSSFGGYGDYSKMTAVNASRDTLSRYLAFRVNNPAHFYCRGTDFLCFIAATVLCLAHIECCRSRQTQPSGQNAFSLLVHTRSSDIGLVEKITEIIQSIAQDLDEDVIASQILCVLNQLLKIVGKVANGVSYGVEAGDGVGEGLAYHGEETDGGEGLQLQIPHFGTIEFLRHGIQRSGPVTTVSQNPTLSTGEGLDFLNVNGSSMAPVPGIDGEWDMQGIDLALFEGLFGESSVLDATGTLSWM